VLIEQGAKDKIVLPVFTDELARELRAGGARVTYRKHLALGHAGVQLLRGPTGEAYRYVRERLG
jgi:hypothetical protein